MLLDILQLALVFVLLLIFYICHHFSNLPNFQCAILFLLWKKKKKVEKICSEGRKKNFRSAEISSQIILNEMEIISLPQSSWWNICLDKYLINGNNKPSPEKFYFLWLLSETKAALETMQTRKWQQVLYAILITSIIYPREWIIHIIPFYFFI